MEWIDGRRAPLGWSEADYDDRGWTPAVVLGPVGTPPFVDLYAQRTRISEHQVAAASVRTLATGSVVVDFGKVYAGRPFVSFDHGSDGHVVPMHVGYSLDPDGSVSTIHNTQGTDLSFQYTQRAGAQNFHPFCYLGFRYLQIDDPGEAIGHGQVTLMARHATMPAVADATFTSSDPVLDRCGPSVPTPASTPPMSSSSTPPPGRRVSSCGTPPTSPRRSCALSASRT